MQPKLRRKLCLRQVTANFGFERVVYDLFATRRYNILQVRLKKGETEKWALL